MATFLESEAIDMSREGRYEIKLICPAWHLPQVHVWMTLHPEGFRQAFPMRQVNSLYFDTLSSESFEDNLAGVGERAKLRLRWYGQEHQGAASQLELKRRLYRLGWKEVQPVPEPLDLCHLSWRELLGRLRQAATPAFRTRLAECDQPALVVSYRRAYYCSADGDLRITLDQDVRLYEQYLQPTPNLSLAAPPGDECIVELKARASLHRRVSDLLSSCPLAVSRNSKYSSGMRRALCFW